ncbi:MAG: hypothetical protein ACHQZR_07475 [Candidatus Limnocylindrales bacterium]
MTWPPSRHALEHGTDQPVPRARGLAAGPLDFTLVGVDVQRVRWGDLELVDRVYMSVRDRNWDTIAPVISGLRIRRDAGHPLVVTFDGRTRAEALDLAWQGTITVTGDGRIVYDMVGEARTDFRYCRIGFCVLHAAAVAAGRPYVAETPGGQVRGVLPRLVAPQTIVDGHEMPLFPACSAIALDLGGVVARADFEGSLFVMEDQRNWTDASFKTCCTVDAPYPYEARRGERFGQRVTISAAGPPPPAPVRRPRPRRVGLDHASIVPWPALGLGTSPQLDRPLAAAEVARLRALGVDHLRVDVRLSTPTWHATLARAVRDARATGARLEIALFADHATLGLVGELTALLQPSEVARVLVFDEPTAANQTTPIELFEAVRARLASIAGSCALVGGTDGDFAELNRDRPPEGVFDGLVYAMNPQVHAFDDGSLVETLAAQATTVATARSFAGARPVLVSPVTLRQRFNPSATDAATPVAGGSLPPAVDARQMSLFAAGWTLGSLAALAGAGAASMTYFETVGWRGIMETGRGPLPARPFASRVGAVFPLYHLFADLADRRATTLVTAIPSTPLEVAALAMHTPRGTRVLLANLTPGPLEVSVGPLASGTGQVRVLDTTTALEAMLTPARFRRRRQRISVERGSARLRLAPFAYLRLDATGG